MLPTLAPGKVCYIQIPALDVVVVQFHAKHGFARNIRRNNDGEVAFDDTVGEVSGTWVTGRPPSSEPGVLVYMMGRERRADVGEDRGGRRRDGHGAHGARGG